jgi:transcriptional regulator with XRE-family HTH domain
MASGKAPKPRPEAQRLNLALKALGKTPAQVSRETGIGQNALSQYAKGKRTISRRDALRLKERYGLTLDWLLAGDPTGLSVGLRDKLQAVSGPPTAPQGLLTGR